MRPMVKTTRARFMVISAIAALSLAVVPPAAAITWGEPDDGGHPNVGAMMVDHPEWGLLQWCSGTLIAPQVFLTAGHCTASLSAFDLTAERVFVTFDDDATVENGSAPALLEVDTVITHPDYWWGPQSNPHDVAVLILKEPVTDITPATLPAEGFLNNLKAEGKLRKGSDGADFTVVGYGASLYWPPPMIAYENQRRSAVSEYQALLKSWLRLSQNQATGDGGTCYGDSGGPTFWTDGGSDVLVAITSWGDARCVATGFNYRIDTADALDFIEECLPE